MKPESLLRHLDDATPWPQGCGLDVGEAYERALTVRQLRIRRGEQPRGFKVGFTNRTIWERYGVYGPIWGTVWNTTLSFCEGEGEIALAGTCQPRIEPECVFGLKATPPARATLDQLLACVEWMAPGFEIVQSHMKDWKFTAADTVADSGLHARLLAGPRIAVDPLAAGGGAAFDARLAAARITLSRGGERIDEGAGANVLEGPLHALAHFLGALRDCPGAPDLLPGDVVTTGTWTDAWPVHRGEQWRAAFDPPLAPLAVRFV
ncbi:fumarylacetoacetate hydrolase family protein [Ramlibacter monticola]|uniref:Hydratase n=1 Tax=Ramlibacter monticola TaxID=1926872 RepID=A0A937CUI1_9BURK|nr:hydratase [Ramlibacter monticola]MBL0393690.1 hydratase [Ramlibacter monticola]